MTRRGVEASRLPWLTGKTRVLQEISCPYEVGRFVVEAGNFQRDMLDLPETRTKEHR